MSVYRLKCINIDLSYNTAEVVCGSVGGRVVKVVCPCRRETFTTSVSAKRFQIIHWRHFYLSIYEIK